jgi:hypothetical protein
MQVNALDPGGLVRYDNRIASSRLEHPEERPPPVRGRRVKDS